MREVLAHVVRVEAGLARGDLHARCVLHVVFEGRPKAIHPQCACPRAFVVEALGDIHSAHLERASEVLDERREEPGPGHGHRALRDRVQQFLGWPRREFTQRRSAKLQQMHGVPGEGAEPLEL